MRVIASPHEDRSPGHRPAWQKPKGIGEKVRSRAHQEWAPASADPQTVAAMTDQRCDGSASISECIAVERYGNIVLFTKKGDLVKVKGPVYESIWLNVPFEKVNWSNWRSQVARIAN